MLLQLAQSVDGLPTRWMQHVQLACCCHRAEVAIDGGKPNGVSPGQHLLVKLLSGSETTGGFQCLDHGRSLLRVARRHSSTSKAAMTPTPQPNASSWMMDFIGSGSLWISGMRSVLAM